MGHSTLRAAQMLVEGLPVSVVFDDDTVVEDAVMAEERLMLVLPSFQSNSTGCVFYNLLVFFAVWFWPNIAM